MGNRYFEDGYRGVGGLGAAESGPFYDHFERTRLRGLRRVLVDGGEGVRADVRSGSGGWRTRKLAVVVGSLYISRQRG